MFRRVGKWEYRWSMGEQEIEVSRCRCNPQAVANILCYTGGIASGTVAPCNVSFCQVVLVNMVVAYGGGHDQLHFAPIKQGAIYTSASANNEHIGIVHIGGCDGCAGEEDAFPQT